jgi:hypothetical protein
MEAQMIINKIGDMFGNSNGVLTIGDWETGLGDVIAWKNEIYQQLLLTAADKSIAGDKEFTVDELDQYLYAQC